MRLVVDTNVIVSALLHPERTPARALAAIERDATILVDDRITAEYRDVLERPKLARIPPERRRALMDRFSATAVRVIAERIELAMIDEDDRPFVEVALSGRADAIVTGNAKHFPPSLGVVVLSPAELLARLGDQAMRARTKDS